ncbi:hypothetical protein [Haloferula rosea]|uniref:Uncharacterized protein n=1 Tax=Haloferula rosea TaxID=490093 RepID=A0A934RDI6_9BACT|nr:hypothetical protein [Haloferula rosea]MBK1828758.1 hypothetical protein [Haloferula rosea]
MSFSTGAAYLQTGPFTVNFQGGDLNLNLRDGNAILSPCPHPSPVIIPPSLPCPIGTTGFIAVGDADDDGVRDDLSFWSLSDVIPAFIIEPFRPELCLLAAAPPSDLLRPRAGFNDRGALIFYNVLTENVVQYDVTIYELARIYDPGPGGRAQMKAELVQGQYIFTFPLLNNPDNAPPIAIPVTYVNIPEGIDPEDRRFEQERSFRFTSGTWDGAGNYLMDPQLTNRITWIGNDGSNTFQGIDFYRLSIVTQDDGITPETVLFPPSQTPLLLLNSFTQEYNLAPFFFAPGDVGLFRLRLDRTLASNAVAFDTSVRLFEFNVRFVDSYDGFKVISFPVGTSVTARAPNVDFDGDGFSNIVEFGLQTDPADVTDVPTNPLPIENGDDTVSFTLTKRPDAVAGYSFLISKDGGPFVEVKANSAEWDIVTNDETTLTITTKDVPPPGTTYASMVRVTAVSL